jgi:hypothetical protein
LLAAGDAFPRIVFDGIRNSGEIQYLRKRCGHRFFLFALECPASERWERLKPQYEARGETFESFTADDKRNKDEEGPFGHRGAVAVSSRADFSGEGELALMRRGTSTSTVPMVSHPLRMDGDRNNNAL